jgi:acetyltransferase-like isoleucine patch superfamily enzyme
MRKISTGPIIVFLLLFSLALVLAIISTGNLSDFVPRGDFRGLVLVGAVLFLFYVYAMILYRIFIRVMPIKEGYIEEGSREEFGYCVYLLFKLFLFFPIIRTKFVPVPLTRMIYRALGARLGSNSYSGGTILDPPLTLIGTDTIIGEDALLFSHAIEGHHLSYAAIHIGNSVTIGAKSVIMSGVKIGHGAIVAAGSVVLKNTEIAPGEVWGGVPARRLSQGTHNKKPD